MEEVDKLINNMAKKLNQDIGTRKNTDRLANDVTALAELITARAMVENPLSNI